MHLNISARHMELTDSLKGHVETRLDKVRVHFDRVIDVEVVLDVEKHRHIAEVTLHANGVRMHSKEASPDMYASIDAAVDKLHKQIHKFKDREGRFAPVKLSEAAVLAEEPALAAVGASAAVEAPEPESRPIFREKISMKPMSVDEAALQLDLLQDRFLVFTNADTQKVNVIYAKDDGSLGVIEPQY